MKQFSTTIFGLLFSVFVCGQKQNKAFAATKGKWRFPVANVKVIDTMTTDCFAIPSPSLTVTLKSDYAAEVRTIQSGRVAIVAEVEGVYMTMVKTGDYFIVYIGIVNPAIKKDDWVEKGSLLGTLAIGDDEETFDLTLMLMKGEKYLNINRWFDWATAHNNCSPRQRPGEQL